MNTTCSICIEDLDGTNNRLTTDCGHCFHTNCFLQNVSHNGFNCPNCRNQLIEEPDLDSDDEDDYDEDDYDDDDEESVDDTSVSVAGPGLEAHMLRGFRWLFQRVEEEDEEEDDEDEEEEEDEEDDPLYYQRGHEEYSESHYPATPIQEVSEKIRLRGFTFNDLVALTVFPHKDNADDMNKYTHAKLVSMRSKIQEILDGTPYEPESFVEFTNDEPMKLSDLDTEVVMAPVEFDLIDESLNTKSKKIRVDLVYEPNVYPASSSDLPSTELCMVCESVEISDIQSSICDDCFVKENLCKLCLETETSVGAICMDCWTTCDEL